MIYVIADSHAHARAWAYEHDHPPREWVHVHHTYQLRGLNNPHVVILAWPSRWSPSDIGDAEMCLALADRGNARIERA